VPQLILPIAFDQKDNAIRVKRLGAGEWMRAGRATGPRVAERLRGILTTRVKARCEEIAHRFDGEDALEAAAQAVEDLAENGSASVNESPLPRSAPASPTAP
jgi:UDP:flavonoid glycosyltransferase YjiC (YdhE family)